MSVASSILKINVYLCTFKNKSSPNVLRLQIKVKFGCEIYQFPFILPVFPGHATELMSSLKAFANTCSPKAQDLLF